jgi:hypothetical protein
MIAELVMAMNKPFSNEQPDVYELILKPTKMQTRLTMR